MSPLTNSVVAATILFLVLLHLPTGVTSIPTQELDTMLSTLHSRGPYNLIANAIATSDLRFDILESTSFTLFAPPDSSLFPLALTLPSPSYVTALRLHLSPRRYSSSDLHRLLLSPSSTAIPTLLPMQSLRLHVSGSALALDNVEVSFPGVFYSHNIAVHGISGTINILDNHRFSPLPSRVPISGAVGRSHGHGNFFRMPRFANWTRDSLKNHGDNDHYGDAASLVDFTPIPAPAPMLAEANEGISGMAAAAGRSDFGSSQTLSPSTTVTSATEGNEGQADPLDLDTPDDEVYVWGGSDIGALFDDFL